MALPSAYHIYYASSADLTDPNRKAPILLSPATTDTLSTTLEFPGRGYINYGEFYNKNLLNLLENFASRTSNTPDNPTIGQIWFNTEQVKLKYYDGRNNDPTTPGWTNVMADDMCADTLHNTKYGCGALNDVTTGGSNVAIGYTALYTNTTGGSNVAVGAGALVLNTTGGGNIAVGYLALQANTTGTYNIAVGVNALPTVTTGTNNIAIGHTTGSGITTGSNNTIIGESLVGLSPTLTNTVIIGSGGVVRMRHDATTLYVGQAGDGGVNASHFTSTDAVSTQFGGAASIGYFQDGTNTAIRTTSAGTIYFQNASGAVEFAHISSSGLTMGTGLPINATGNLFTSNGTTGGNIFFKNQLNMHGNPVTSWDYVNNNYNGATAVVAIGVGVGFGTIRLNNGGYYDFALLTHSDETVKENIRPSTEYSLSKIDDIDFISFTYGDKAGPAFVGQQWKVGVSAQQLQTIEPEWVTSSTGGALQLADNKLLIAALQAIQELSAQVKTLQAEVEILKAN
jgi:hypothetical protein